MRSSDVGMPINPLLKSKTQRKGKDKSWYYAVDVLGLRGRST
jgi:hypothetical protein